MHWQSFVRPVTSRVYASSHMPRTPFRSSRVMSGSVAGLSVWRPPWGLPTTRTISAVMSVSVNLFCLLCLVLVLVLFYFCFFLFMFLLLFFLFICSFLLLFLFLFLFLFFSFLFPSLPVEYSQPSVSMVIWRYVCLWPSGNQHGTLNGRERQKWSRGIRISSRAHPHRINDVVRCVGSNSDVWSVI